MSTYDLELCFTLPSDDPASPSALERITVLTHPGRPNCEPERWLVHLYKNGRRIKAILRLALEEKVSAVLVDGSPVVFHVTHLTGPYGKKGA